MKSKSLLIPLLAVAVLIIGVLYFGIVPILQNANSLEIGLASTHIVYECEDQGSIDVTSICIVRADGSDQRILDVGQRSGTEPRWSPSINSSGEVVFECRAGPSVVVGENLNDICFVNADGTGFMRLNSPEFGENEHPQINNAGQIVFQCGDSICTIDGIVGRARVIALAQNGAVYSDPVINDAGLVAFVCIENVPAEICLVRQEGSEIVKLTEAVPDQFFTSPDINDAGWVVFECGNSDQVNICLMHSSGEGFRQLTSADSDSSYWDPSINESGQIVFQCRHDEQNHICYINLFLDDYIQLTEDDAGPRSGRNTDPSINNAGLVAYNCDRNICVIQINEWEKREVNNILVGDVVITDVVIE